MGERLVKPDIVDSSHMATVDHAAGVGSPGVQALNPDLTSNDHLCHAHIKSPLLFTARLVSLISFCKAAVQAGLLRI